MARRALIDPRLARMIRRDRQVAGAAVFALWCVTCFVFCRVATLVGPTKPAFVAMCATVGLSTLVLISVSIHALIQRGFSDGEVMRVYGPEIQDDEIEEFRSEQNSPSVSAVRLADDG